MDDSILLVLPLPAHQVEDRIYLDDQACYGLELWLENFKHVTVCCPTDRSNTAPDATRPIDTIHSFERLMFEPLPFGYTPPTFLINLLDTNRRLSRLIDQSIFLQFAIGGFWGDWGSVAAIIASRKERRFAVWTDRVESRVMEFQSSTLSGPKRLYRSLNAKLASRLEHFVIRRSSVGLFNGMDCYQVYSPMCENPQVVANFNYAKGTHISRNELTGRLTELNQRRVRFVYAGRAHRDKGIFDWIEAFSELDGDFTATWLGDGPELQNAREIVQAKGRQNQIVFSGTISHDQLLMQLKQYDAFVFCHKTQESPRCLIEALACGVPIVGYRSDYSEQLIAQNSGGMLSAIHDVPALSDSLRKCLADRQLLKDLAQAATLDGEQFTSEETFRHRSMLIRAATVNVSSGTAK